MAWPGVSRNTKILSWLGATVCVAIWHSRAAIQRCDMAAACCDTACYTARRAHDTTHIACVMSWVAIQFLYCDGRGILYTAVCARDMASARYDTPVRRQSLATIWCQGAMIRPSTRHDTALSALYAYGLGVVPSQGLGCASCAPTQF